MHIFSIMRNIRVVDPSVMIEKRSDPDRTSLNIQIQNPNFNIFWSKLRMKKSTYIIMILIFILRFISRKMFRVSFIRSDLDPVFLVGRSQFVRWFRPKDNIVFH